MSIKDDDDQVVVQVDPSVTDPAFVSEAKAGSKINFWSSEKRGFSPMGMATLVKAAGVDKVSYWHRGKTPYLYGVLLFQPRVAQKVVDEVLARIASVYPVHEGMKRMGVIVFEKGSMRGLHAVGDYDDIVRFWCDMSTGTCAVASIDIQKDSVCWTVMNPSHYFIPYLDIDELGTANDFSNLWLKRVKVCLDLVLGMLREWQEEPVYQVFFNCRKSEKYPGLYKYSYHIHFYKSLVTNINTFKSTIKKLPGMPHKREWTKTGASAYTVKEDTRGFIFDSAVYGGRKQLFRGPYCGKGGDSAAQMLPVDVLLYQGEAIGNFIGDEDEDIRHEYIFRSRISSPLCDAAGMVLCALAGQDDVTSRIDNAEYQASFDQIEESSVFSSSSALYEFMKPIVYAEVVPAWQIRREQDAKKTGGSGWTVPTTTISIVKDIPHTSKPTVRILKVSGDTYCETDGQHYHSRNPTTVSLCVDLHKCVIWQNCFACGSVGQKYHFLHTGNKIVIKSRDECKVTHEEFFHPVETIHTFMLQYYSDLFRFHQPTESLYVLDSDCMVWRTGSSANSVVGRLFDTLNTRYTNYVQERRTIIFEKEWARYLAGNPSASDDAKEKKKDALVADGRKFINKFKSIANLSVTARSKLIDDLRNFPVKYRVPDMNAFPHVIPMKNLQAYDVFTGETHEFKSHHLFTSIVNAELSSDSEDIKAIDDWFSEIATGDNEKATFLKIISGYMMTFLLHDRRFYVLKGTGKNGKGIHKQFLVAILSGARNTEARWKALNQAFWEKKANSNTSAEAPSPEAHGMLNKTLFYTDDIERVTIDAGKVKRVVAGEVMSGRGLYSKPVVIEPKGKILWTTNHTADLPGNDNAIWERYVHIDYNTKYVEKPEQVDRTHYKILQNDVAVQDLLLKTDAFFTVCVRELTRYYKALPFNQLTGQPVTLSHFPTPSSVSQAKAEARAQQLPLAKFISTQTIRVVHPLEFTEVGEMFSAYINFLEQENERRVRNETTQTSFVRQLATSLEIKCSATKVTSHRIHARYTHRSHTGDRIQAD